MKGVKFKWYIHVLGVALFTVVSLIFISGIWVWVQIIRLFVLGVW